MTLRKICLFTCLVLICCAGIIAQTVTGSLVGIVVDPAGSVVPGASVQLTNQGTSATIIATTDSAGLVRFPNLLPATYRVAVQAKGFKTRVESDITVGLAENRDLGQLALELGNVTDTITVAAEATVVQTSTAERSSVIDGNQLNNEAIRGRRK